MKTIRLLYPDHASGGLDTYWFGARLMQHIIPENPGQRTVEVSVAPPHGGDHPVTDGITDEAEVLSGIRDAKRKIRSEAPDGIVTIGGNCLVSLAPFDYLHGLYPDAGIVWIDAHPDVSTPEDGYPFAHAMVLGTLLGGGSDVLRSEMENPPFAPDHVMHVGLQGIHGYQRGFLEKAGVAYEVQDREFVPEDDVRAFVGRFDRVLVHLDIDVLDPALFHSTYFANPDLVGDGTGGGRMDIPTLDRYLHAAMDGRDVVGFTIAEYLPFDEERLGRVFDGLPVLTRRSSVERHPGEDGVLGAGRREHALHDEHLPALEPAELRFGVFLEEPGRPQAVPASRDGDVGLERLGVMADPCRGEVLRQPLRYGLRDPGGVHAHPDDGGPPLVREGPRSGEPHLERGEPVHGPAHAVLYPRDLLLVDIAYEAQREVRLSGRNGPGAGRLELPPEPVRLLRPRDVDGDEHPDHHPLSSGCSAMMCSRSPSQPRRMSEYAFSKSRV